MGINLFFVLLVAALRWQCLLYALNLPVNWARAILLTFIGNFFNAVLPGSVSGDVIKGYYIFKLRPKDGKGLMAFSLLADRVLGFAGFLWGASAVALWGWLSEPEALAPLSPYLWTILALASVSLGGLLALLYGPQPWLDFFHSMAEKLPLKGLFLSLMQTFERFRGAPRLVWASAALAVVNYWVILWMFRLITEAYEGQPGPWAAHAVIVVTALLVITVPIAPAGLGVGHLAFAVLYQLVGFSEGASIFNLYFLALWIGNLLGGFIYLFYRPPAPEEADSEPSVN